MLRKLIFALLFQSHNVNLDYRNCIKVDLASQVLLDVIFKECGDFISKLRHIDGGKAQQLFATAMGGHHIENENVMLAENQLKYQGLISSINQEFTNLQTVMK